jgi:uncharacterized protein YeaO (DUF488 family)
MTCQNLHIKRVCEPADTAHGACVLVDRLWPRGLQPESLGPLQDRIF